MIMMTISFKILQQMVLYIVHHDNPPLPFPFYSACFKNFCCCKIMFQEILFVEALKDHGTISRKKYATRTLSSTLVILKVQSIDDYFGINIAAALTISIYDDIP